MIHMDNIVPDKPFEKYYCDWMARFNNEPYMGALQDEDMVGICEQAGFDRNKVRLGDAIARFRAKSTDEKANYEYRVVCAPASSRKRLPPFPLGLSGKEEERRSKSAGPAALDQRFRPFIQQRADRGSTLRNQRHPLPNA